MHAESNCEPYQIKGKLLRIHEDDVRYSDVIMIGMASQITSITIVYSTIFQVQMKENIKAPRHWRLWGEFTGDRWIPCTNGQ